jgi:ABC-2 type transporter
MLTTPIEPDDVLAGEILWAVTRSCIYGGCFFVVLVIFGLAPLPRSLWAILVIPITELLFAAIGMVFSLRIPNFDMFSFYFTLFLTLLFLFSDVFFPLKERLQGHGSGSLRLYRCSTPCASRELRSTADFLRSHSGIWPIHWERLCCCSYGHGTARRARPADKLITVNAASKCIPARLETVEWE